MSAASATAKRTTVLMADSRVGRPQIRFICAERSLKNHETAPCRLPGARGRVNPKRRQGPRTLPRSYPRCRMGRTRAFALGLFPALAAGLLAAEAPVGAPGPKPIAVVGATVRTQTDAGDIVGTIVVRDGKVTALGKDVPIPADATRIDGTGCVVAPGLIDARGALGLNPAAAREGGRDAT